MMHEIEWSMFLNLSDEIKPNEVINLLERLMGLNENERALKIDNLAIQNIRFSYKKTSMHIRIYFVGMSDAGTEISEPLFSTMRDLLSKVEDIPNLFNNIRSMKVSVDNAMSKREEFSQIPATIDLSIEKKKFFNLMIIIAFAVGFIFIILTVLWLIFFK